MMKHRTRQQKKIIAPNLYRANVDNVLIIGHGHYLVLDKYETKSGRAYWLEVQRLPSQFDRQGGVPFRMMVLKRRD